MRVNNEKDMEILMAANLDASRRRGSRLVESAATVWIKASHGTLSKDLSESSGRDTGGTVKARNGRRAVSGLS